MKGNFSCDDERVPSYEESVSSSDFSSPHNRTTFNQSTAETKSTTRPFQSQIASTRSLRIRSVLAAYVEPLLESQGSNGISESTLILIPSDVLSSLPNIKATDLVGLPESARNVTVIRLHGPENQATFWEQPAVVRQLITDLNDRLAASGHRIEEPLVPQKPPLQRPKPPASGRSSWLRKSFATNQSQSSDPTASMSHWKLGWNAEDGEGGATRSLGLDEYRLHAKVKDISVMTESDLGLLLTETVKGIWLDVEVGT